MCCVHRAQGTRVLVHCKMGVSRSAATVVAYAMKQYGWSLEQALRHVQELRPIARPNPGFLRQLQTYQGILTARYRVGGTGETSAGGGRWGRPLGVAPGLLRADSGPPSHSRQSHVWEQKVGGASPEDSLAPEVSAPFPPVPPEPGGGGEVMAVGLEESQASAKEEPGPRPRINLRGVMRSISLLEPPPELESTSEAGDLPEVRLGVRKEPRLGVGSGGGSNRRRGQVAGGRRKTRTSAQLSALSEGRLSRGAQPRQLPLVPSSSRADLVRAGECCLPRSRRAAVGLGHPGGSGSQPWAEAAGSCQPGGRICSLGDRAAPPCKSTLPGPGARPLTADPRRGQMQWSQQPFPNPRGNTLEGRCRGSKVPMHPESRRTA